MRFLGEYRDYIKNGKVSFPWIVEDEKLTWIIAEITQDGLTTSCCEICNADELDEALAEREKHVEEVKILSKGDLVLDADDMWQVPEEILIYLKTDEIMFLGAFCFVEIFSAEDLERYEQLFGETEDELEEAVIE